MVWLTIKFTAPRQYVNFLADSTADDQAKSELQVAGTLVSGLAMARDLSLSWVVVAMQQRFVVVGAISNVWSW